MEIEEPAAPADDAGGSTRIRTRAPTQPFLSSANKAGVPELSIPRSPYPVAEAAAVALAAVPPSTDIGTATHGGAGLNGEWYVRGVEGDGSARRQVSDDDL